MRAFENERELFVFCVYAPCEPQTVEAKNEASEFWFEFEKCILDFDVNCNVIIGGDLNCRFSSDDTQYNWGENVE